MGPTQTIAAFAAQTRLGDIPQRAIEQAKIAILDTFGVALAAAGLPIGHTIAEYVRSLGGDPVARVLGAGFRTSPPLAALANGTLAHALDFDDRGHLSTYTLPSALAIGELLHRPGARALEAYVVSREVSARLVEAIEARRKEHGGPTYRGWYRVGVVGPIGAAIAAGKLLDLDASAMAMAIGIAASSAAGLRRNQGTMTKALHAGNGARDGVQAALLAGRGFTADPEILESPLGFFNALCLPGECDLEPIMARLGRPFELERPVGIKPFPACSPSHKPIEAILHLRREHAIRAEDVESIESDPHGFSLFRTDPQEAMAAGFSLPYLLAVAVIDGDVGVDHHSEKRIHDPEVRSLMRRVRAVPASGPDDAPERITVRLRDGRTLLAEVPRARDLGTAEEIEQKYRDCAGRILAAEDVTRLQEQIAQIEHVDDVNELVVALPG